MAESPVVGIRFPEDILEQVDAIAKREGVNRSQTILKLVKAALGIEPTPDTAAILEEIAELRELVQKKLLT